MNKVSLMERRWRKRTKRGVSPIIATILLVAITVVLAAVLYILISGLTSGPGSTPLSVQFGQGTPSKSGTTFYDTFQIAVSSGITTAQFGLKITDTTGAPVGAGTAATCSGTYAPGTNCLKPTSGWYAVLISSNGTVVATFDSSGAWSATHSISNANSIVLVSASQLSGTSDSLAAYGLSGSSVSGSTTL